MEKVAAAMEVAEVPDQYEVSVSNVCCVVCVILLCCRVLLLK